MRHLAKNKQKLWYALYIGQEEVFEVDDNGDIVYDEIDGERVPRTTGRWVSTYERPVAFYGNINSGNVGEAVARSYGLSLAASEAILCMRKGELPIDEHALIWYQREPQVIQKPISLLDESGDALVVEQNGEVIIANQMASVVVPESADYCVKRVPPCLDEIIYLLGRLDNATE